MKTTFHIGSFDLKALIFLLAGSLFIISCGQNTEDAPANKLYRAKPVKSVPEKKVEQEKIIHADTADTSKLIPSDSLQNNLQDTTETLHNNERKPDIKISKRYFYLHLHKKPLIS